MLSRISFSFLYDRHFDVLYYLGHMFRPLDFFYVIHVDLIIGSRWLIPAFHLVLYMALLPRDQRHQYLRFEGFEERLGRIYSRGIHQMLVLDFKSLPAMMSEGLTSRMLMEHRDDQG
ncbi:hypothetical protein Tco_0000682 [Tanacetum coccineum]